MYTVRDKYAEDEYMKDLAREEGIEIGRVEGREEGIGIGIGKGRDEERIAIASKLKLIGLPVSQIVEVTSLTVEEIEAL